jgi:SAM-dependent methyltransferase
MESVVTARRQDAPPATSEGALPGQSCRFCGAALSFTVIDLGMSPLCESFVLPEQADEMEPFFPLHVRACETCLLVQLPAYVSPEVIFREYAYFSSYSDSWLEHARRYAQEVTQRFGLGSSSFIVEVASNDGYLLRNFAERGFRCLGIEPALNVAEAARAAGIETVTEFFGRAAAETVRRAYGSPDLIVANNVLAHVPDVNDFAGGISSLLAPAGVATFEFPHLVRLVAGTQYDTIYHEHYSYLTLLTSRAILARHGLDVFDVEELATHGGSLRLFAAHAGTRAIEPAVAELEAEERAAGYGGLAVYERFRSDVERSKRALLAYLIGARSAGKRVAAYGAPGKGNTLLNYCGIRTDLVEYAVDRNPYKHGRLTPGTHIPIYAPERLAETQPDVILIVPWNLRDEIAAQLDYTREWGATLVVPIPSVATVEG